MSLKWPSAPAKVKHEKSVLLDRVHWIFSGVDSTNSITFRKVARDDLLDDYKRAEWVVYVEAFEMILDVVAEIV